MSNSILKSIWAVFAGFVSVFVLSVGTDFILESLRIFPPAGYKLRNLYDFLTVNNFPTSNYTTNYTGKFYPQYTHSIELEGKKIEATIATLDDVFPPYPSLKFVSLYQLNLSYLEYEYCVGSLLLKLILRQH
jgi:hypothetical protein